MIAETQTEREGLATPEFDVARTQLEAIVSACHAPLDLEHPHDGDLLGLLSTIRGCARIGLSSNGGTIVTDTNKAERGASGMHSRVENLGVDVLKLRDRLIAAHSTLQYIDGLDPNCVEECIAAATTVTKDAIAELDRMYLELDMIECKLRPSEVPV